CPDRLTRTRRPPRGQPDHLQPVVRLGQGPHPLHRTQQGRGPPLPARRHPSSRTEACGMTAHVYTFRAIDGTVLCVGCTERIGRRLLQHEYKPWWPEVVRIDLSSAPNVVPLFPDAAVEARR